MFIVAWISTNDHFTVVETLDEAHEIARGLKTREGVLCWGIGPVLDASEPHWYLPAIPGARRTGTDGDFVTDFLAKHIKKGSV